MVGLVDTAILVDILRLYPPAIAWANAQTDTIGVCNVVYMELISGANNKADQKKAIALLKGYQLVFLTETDMKWAIQKQLTYSLSHGMGIMDCMIASVNARLKLPLYTHNLKHFSPLLGQLVQKPYN